ncbi:MAG: hypothetical protein ABSE55_15750 [Terracidiphilus sp.]|jgi:hypothetical protein
MANESLQALVIELESHLPQLKERRAKNALANDCYEAADDWRHLGRRVLENDTRVNYPERVRGEYELLAQLREILQNKPVGDRLEYEQLLNTGEELLKIVGEVQPPKDGHLGFLRIVRSLFEFLQTEFDFSVVGEGPTCLRFSSGAVYLELKHSIDPWMSCGFGPEPEDSKTFWIHDLLYLNHDERYRVLPDRLEMNTELEIEDWFGFLASVFKQYGFPILRNSPEIFKALTEAQAERDAAYVHEMDLKYSNKGDAPG